MFVWNEGLIWAVITLVMVVACCFEYSVTRPSKLLPFINVTTRYWDGRWLRPILVIWFIVSAIVYLYKWWPDLPR